MTKLFQMTIQVMSGELSYYDYSVEVRNAKYLIPQILNLGSFLVVACILEDFPLWSSLVMFYWLITGLLFTRRAYTEKREMVMSLIWAIQGFVVAVGVGLLMVYFRKI